MKKKSFTLVELLIVIAIIAILASMILPALKSALDKARAISCTSNHKQLGTTTFLYADDNNGYMPAHNIYYHEEAKLVKWPTILWSYVTHTPITYDTEYLKYPHSSAKPKLSIFRCPAVLDTFIVDNEVKHIGRNHFMNGYYEKNLFISSHRWPSARMLYSDFYSPWGYTHTVGHFSTGGYSSVGYMTYLHPGLTATVTHIDGHVKAWNMHAVPQNRWNSRFWGENATKFTGENP